MMTLRKLKFLYWFFNAMSLSLLIMSVYGFFSLETGGSFFDFISSFILFYFSGLAIYASKLVDEGTTDDQDSNLLLFFMVIDMKDCLKNISGWYPGVFSGIRMEEFYNKEDEYEFRGKGNHVL